MFLFALFFIITWLAGIPVPIMKYKITTVWIILNYGYINIWWHRVDILDLWLKWHWVWVLYTGSSHYVMAFHSKVRTSQFQWENTTIGQFITPSTIPFQFIVLDHIWIYLPLSLMIFPAPQNILIYLWSTSSCHLCYLWKLY